MADDLDLSIFASANKKKPQLTEPIDHELVNRIKKLLSLNVHQEWKDAFEGPLSDHFNTTCINLSRLDLNTIAPAPSRIMKAFELGISQIKVIIVGQDPYTHVRDATGLAFANNKTTKNQSLQTIMITTDCSDVTLTSWLAQGVWLINSILTATSGGKPYEPQHLFWKDFMTAVFKHVVETSPSAKIVVLAWGSKAREVVQTAILPIGSAKIVPFYRIHPSPTSNNPLPPSQKFEMTDHFIRANQELVKSDLTPILWNTKPLDFSNVDYIIVTDGACTGNGKKDAKAALAFCILKKKDQTPNKCLLSKDDYEEITQYSKIMTLDDAYGEDKLTNNLAEGRAIIEGSNCWYQRFGKEFITIDGSINDPLVCIQRRVRIAIVSDSEYCLGMISGNEAQKNIGMVKQLRIVSTVFDPILVHVRGHQNDDGTLFVEYNNIVDKMANGLIGA